MWIIAVSFDMIEAAAGLDLRQDDFIYAIEAYEDDPECPLFTNCVKTEFGKKLVTKRFEEQGLSVIVRSIAEMRGLNPYWETEY